MGTSGGTMIQRPPQPPFSPMRGGPMQSPTGVKRPSDTRAALVSQKM